jgi:hypothetical protein
MPRGRLIQTARAEERGSGRAVAVRRDTQALQPAAQVAALPLAAGVVAAGEGAAA